MKGPISYNREPEMSSHPPVSLVVLTWNGKHLLEECLPSVVRAAESYPGQTEIVVVDDGSGDGSEQYLRSTFPAVRIERLEKNTGFPNACNTGVKSSKHELVFLLNNDMILDSACIEPMVTHFNNNKIFAVGPLMRLHGSEEVFFSCCAAKFSRGFLLEHWVAAGGKDKCEDLSPSLYLSGGAMLFRKHVFESLGMMDTLYHPFYCEDFDICYRAWKRGYYLLFEPRSIVYHKLSATIRTKFPADYYELIHRRNMYLLIWRNITDPLYLLEHVLFLFPRLLKRTIKGEFMEVKAFLLAVSRLPIVVKKRRGKKENELLSDREICDMLSPEKLQSLNLGFEPNLDTLALKQTRTPPHE